MVAFFFFFQINLFEATFCREWWYGKSWRQKGVLGCDIAQTHCSARAVSFVSTLHKPGTREMERGQRTCKQPSRNSGTSGNKTLTTLFFFKLFFFPALAPLNSRAMLFCQYTIFLSIMISPWLCLQWLCWPPLCMFVINVFILLLNLVLVYGPWKKIGISCGKRFKLLLHENFTLSSIQSPEHKDGNRRS